MTEKIDLNKLYHESKKERTEKQQTKMERALEGVVCGLSRKAAVSLINRNKNSQDKFKI
jgi:hypothetical protein